MKTRIIAALLSAGLLSAILTPVNATAADQQKICSSKYSEDSIVIENNGQTLDPGHCTIIFSSWKITVYGHSYRTGKKAGHYGSCKRSPATYNPVNKYIRVYGRYPCLEDM